MVHVIDRGPSFGGNLGQALGNLGGGLIAGQFENRRQEKEQQRQQNLRQQEASGLQQIFQSAGPNATPQSLSQALLQSNLSNETKGLGLQYLKSMQDYQTEQTRQGTLNNLLGFGQPGQDQIQQPNQGQLQSPDQNMMQSGQQGQPGEARQSPMRLNPEDITNEKIAAAAIVDPRYAQVLQGMKDNYDKRTKADKQAALDERAFETSYSKEAVKDADSLRRSLPKKENALSFARNAYETGNTSYFSLDKLADATGIDLFRTAKGAQLITAAKENLLSNMERVSAKGQNIWFEQRLNSMFAKIGQTEEANATIQEMLESELFQDKAYLSEFDRLAEEDIKNYGFERRDIAKRAHKNVEDRQEEIFKRATIRMKEIEERELGVSKLKSQVGKPVVKGTPLTFAMGKLYHDKYGDKALEMAKKNGYYIPTLDEYRIFQSSPREYGKQL